MKANDFEKIKKNAQENKYAIVVYKDGVSTPINSLEELPFCEGFSLGQAINELRNENANLRQELSLEIKSRQEAQNQILDIMSKLNKGGK